MKKQNEVFTDTVYTFTHPPLISDSRAAKLALEELKSISNGISGLPPDSILFNKASWNEKQGKITNYLL